MLSSASLLDGVSHFDFQINDKNFDSSVRTLISHIKKSWNLSKLHKKAFDDGITNKLIGFYVDNGDLKVSTQFGEYGRSDIVLIRIYGSKTELIINRAQELRNFKELANFGISPSLYCTFGNGYCYQFIEGKVLTPSDISNGVLQTHCSSYMAKLHSIQLSESYLRDHNLESTLFCTLHKYANLVPKEYQCAEKQKRFKEEIPTIEVIHQEIETLSQTISMFNDLPISFCHNDLLAANFIFDEHNEKMFTIDYEYGSPGYTAYDIANHFNEYAGIENVDYNNYPSKANQIEWLRNYLERTNEIKGISSEVSNEDIEQLYIQVNVFALVSHLFWGIWALVQANFSSIDFDYMKYSSIRIGEYYNRKEEFMALCSEGKKK